MIALPRAFGPAVLDAALRSRPEDFRVEEKLGFAADGRGEHLLVRVEKRGANTVWVAKQLARWAGVPEFAVGYAGLKDRHAVTVQTFSLHLPGREPPAEWPVSDEFRVLDAARHARKLQRGALRGNRFEIVLRDVAGERAAIEQRLREIAAHGVPNAFGEQRFGRDGGNLDAARAMFAGRRVRREERSILLSAARSELFNAVLAARVEDGSWNRGVDGDVWMLDGSHSVFGPAMLDDALAARAAAFDIHPTGPMWGSGELRTGAAARALEQRALQPHADLLEPLAAAGLRQERRALRVRAGHLDWTWLDAASLQLGFELPSGSYATSVVHELGTTRVANATNGTVAAHDEE